MKHIIILGDGMADHSVARLGGRTLLQYAHTPYMDRIAREGRCGRMLTIPDGFHPGSEVANTAILGYDLNKVYEGRRHGDALQHHHSGGRTHKESPRWTPQDRRWRRADKIS